MFFSQRIPDLFVKPLTETCNQMRAVKSRGFSHSKGVLATAAVLASGADDLYCDAAARFVYSRPLVPQTLDSSARISRSTARFEQGGLKC